MSTFKEQLDQNLLDLAWSLWTELGVAGVKRKHQNCLIMLEELILLTLALAEVDPRLRDEALDWCSRYHHFISIGRLKTLTQSMKTSIDESFSLFGATLNSASTARWPLLTPTSPLKFVPSGKSKPPNLEKPALLSFRLRGIFGVGARADVILFFLSHEKTDFAASDVAEIGYSKRAVVDVLDDFTAAGLFKALPVRNQNRYSFVKQTQTIQLLGTLPKYMPPWRALLEIILPLRACIHRTEQKSETTKVVEMRNELSTLQNQLSQLNLIPPPMQPDLHAYWTSLTTWLVNLTQMLASGEFP